MKHVVNGWLLRCAKVQLMSNLSHMQMRVMICDQVRDTEKNVRATRSSVFVLDCDLEFGLRLWSGLWNAIKQVENPNWNHHWTRNFNLIWSQNWRRQWRVFLPSRRLFSRNSCGSLYRYVRLTVSWIASRSVTTVVIVIESVRNPVQKTFPFRAYVLCILSSRRRRATFSWLLPFKGARKHWVSRTLCHDPVKKKEEEHVDRIESS